MDRRRRADGDAEYLSALRPQAVAQKWKTSAGRVRIGVRFLVAHDQRRILQRHSDPAAEGYDLVVSGHKHGVRRLSISMAHARLRPA